MVQGYNKPANQIIADTEDLVTHEYEIGPAATEAKMKPGIAVIMDTNDWCVKEAGLEAKDILGVLDVRQDMLITGTYTRGQQCRVIERGKAMVRMPAGGTATTEGLPLVTNANGLFTVQAVGLLGEQGAPVAYALEANAHAAESLVLAYVTGQREAATA